MIVSHVTTPPRRLAGKRQYPDGANHFNPHKGVCSASTPAALFPLCVSRRPTGGVWLSVGDGWWWWRWWVMIMWQISYGMDDGWSVNNEQHDIDRLMRCNSSEGSWVGRIAKIEDGQYEMSNRRHNRWLVLVKDGEWGAVNGDGCWVAGSGWRVFGTSGGWQKAGYGNGCGWLQKACIGL